MIIDPSAIIAILNDEPERRAFTEAIEQSGTCLLSVAGFVEASMVIDNYHGYDGLRDFDLLLADAGIELAPVDAEQAHMARQAFRQYGKGRHPAALNFGDCFSYALAQATGFPLLFKGNDFTKTDIQAAISAY
ncbi:MAG TPA: type II toxin-antitoxin system VapC family toxin [Chthoniobacterales bacterium]|jgi:ribonuclease VapC|nr:type II toxin-antitoxin system VapC family toxin [Chthoniobacterales bacterium]